MKLLTKAILNALKKAPLYSTDGKDKAPVIVKFFCPWNQWTWYAVEGSPTCAECGAFDCNDPTHGEKTEFTFFGLVVGQEKELGYFNLRELESVTGPGGLKIERDMYYDGYFLDKKNNNIVRAGEPKPEPPYRKPTATPAQPCTASDMTFGGKCMNCGGVNEHAPQPKR
jgi:hypothetical protein